MEIAALLILVWFSSVNAEYLNGLGGEVDDLLDRFARESPGDHDLLIKYEVDWPSKEVWEELGPVSAAVPADPNGMETLVLHRADRSWDIHTFDENNKLRNISKGPISDGVLAKLDSGKLVEKYLKNLFYIPHGLSIDPQGNVWITDVGLHQIFKFSPDLDDTPLLVLGEALQPGTDEKHFCKPTHVVVARNGDFFVSDGYCNSRILKFNADGKLITQWGEKPTGSPTPGPYELNIPHQMILIEEEDVLCVADRQNKRVVCYKAGLNSSSQDQTGQFAAEIRTMDGRPESVYGIAYCPHTRTMFLLVGPTHQYGDYEVQMYDLKTKKFIGSKIDDQQGYGDAHTISTCGSLRGSGCLLVSSLSEPETDDWGNPLPRLWFYRLLSVPSN